MTATFAESATLRPRHNERALNEFGSHTHPGPLLLFAFGIDQPFLPLPVSCHTQREALPRSAEEATNERATCRQSEIDERNAREKAGGGSQKEEALAFFKKSVPPSPPPDDLEARKALSLTSYSDVAVLLNETRHGARGVSKLTSPS